MEYAGEKEIQKFCKDISLKRFKEHCLNKDLELSPALDEKSAVGNIWRAGILWGNDNIHGVLIVKFTTINILAMASSVFEGANDSDLFEHTKDFMKEYCNLYAGLIKGTFDNSKMPTFITLPIITRSLTVDACFGGDKKNNLSDSWCIKSGNSFIELESTIHFKNKVELEKLKFVGDGKAEEGHSEGDIDFF
jgi:hypothetical protein